MASFIMVSECDFMRAIQKYRVLNRMDMFVNDGLDVFKIYVNIIV